MKAARHQVVMYDGGRRRVIATRATKAEAADVMWPLVFAQAAVNMKIEPVLVWTNG